MDIFLEWFQVVYPSFMLSGNWWDLLQIPTWLRCTGRGNRTSVICFTSLNMSKNMDQRRGLTVCSLKVVILSLTVCYISLSSVLSNAWTTSSGIQSKRLADPYDHQSTITLCDYLWSHWLPFCRMPIHVTELHFFPRMPVRFNSSWGEGPRPDTSLSAAPL